MRLPAHIAHGMIESTHSRIIRWVPGMMQEKFRQERGDFVVTRPARTDYRGVVSEGGELYALFAPV